MIPMNWGILEIYESSVAQRGPDKRQNIRILVLEIDERDSRLL